VHEFGFALVLPPTEEEASAGHGPLLLKVGKMYAENDTQARQIAASRIDEECLKRGPAERIDIQVTRL
jgi:hypothetical protein